MTRFRVLRATERHARAWKNGGGVTTDIISYPADSGSDGFDWRISLAEIDREGPFSRFDGVDRVATVLAGTLELRLAEASSATLDAGSDPLHFAGELPAFGAPMGGPVLNLNVMTRRGAHRAVVDRVDASGSIVMDAPALLLALVPVTLEMGGSGIDLGRLDAVLAITTMNVGVPTKLAGQAVRVRLERA